MSSAFQGSDAARLAAAGGADPRQRILEAALRLFADKGFDAVTLRAIGTKVGLHNSSLFHHFPSKAEMARAVFDRVLENVLPRLESLTEDDPPDLERFIAAMLELADHFHAHPEEARFLTRAVVDPSLFFDADTGGQDRSDAQNPVVRLFMLIWGWLDRAEAAQVIRSVAVLQTTRNLFGLLIFEPSYALGTTYPGSPAQEPELHLSERRQELADFLHGGLAPVGSGG
jgi:AcrR family transcriptional regulator